MISWAYFSPPVEILSCLMPFFFHFYMLHLFYIDRYRYRYDAFKQYIAFFVSQALFICILLYLYFIFWLNISVRFIQLCSAFSIGVVVYFTWISPNSFLLLIILSSLPCLFTFFFFETWLSKMISCNEKIYFPHWTLLACRYVSVFLYFIPIHKSCFKSGGWPE